MKINYSQRFKSGFHINLILFIIILFLAEIIIATGKIAESQTIQGAQGRFNFGELYKDAVTICGNIKLDIAYQDSRMKIGDKMNVIHNGLYADDTKIKKAKECLKSFEAPKGKVIIGYRPEPNIIIAISGFDEKSQYYFKPILNYEVNDKLWVDKAK